ncbi:MAG TPA: phenylalanine--tRNA ligase subunit beta [Candidatus Saccharimonadales bacterium]|nr:phenylalanine--tRNA ligase subunit beta [Candidatus Saccharimonadales bacterium]
MLAPLSWLKDYVNIKSDLKALTERLGEIGLGTEEMTKTQDGDIILDLEVTPNRPDLLSIVGIAREIAAIENTQIKYPNSKTDLKIKKDIKILPLKIHSNYKITPRLTGIIINNVSVKESPKWLKEKLEKLGNRPINNIVDITNFVMYELGNPIHSFDYNKITGHEMWIKQSAGGEKFESVDGISYHLPKGAIIFEDAEKIFDLVGIKGGKNSGTYKDTKTVFIAIEVDDPILIRKASLALSLRSDASAIFERNVNKGGTIDALKRTVDLILELAGGEIASELIDLKEEEFNPWKVSLRINKLNSLLGIEIPEKKVLEILGKLNLQPKLKENVIEVTVPTYRNDLKIEEDIIEEVARLYGYSNFPHTLQIGEIRTEKIPYFKNYNLDEKIKNFIAASGYSEIYTYALISENDLQQEGINSEDVLRVDTPVSHEYEYLRPNLKINLRKALYQNKLISPKLNLFEIGKIYYGENLDKAEERYNLAGITNDKNFFEVKGILENLYKMLEIDEDPTEHIEQIEEGIYFEIDYTELTKKSKAYRTFIPVPKFPPVIEDMAILAPSNISIGDIIKTIKKQSNLISEVSILDKYEQTRTFHIVYQSTERNLTGKEVGEIRVKILKALKDKHGAKLK